MPSRPLTIGVILLAGALATVAQDRPVDDRATATVLRPARVFDGETMHDGWAVRVAGNRIEAVGPAASIATGGARVVDLAGLR